MGKIFPARALCNDDANAKRLPRAAKSGTLAIVHSELLLTGVRRSTFSDGAVSDNDRPDARSLTTYRPDYIPDYIKDVTQSKAADGARGCLSTRCTARSLRSVSRVPSSRRR